MCIDFIEWCGDWVLFVDVLFVFCEVIVVFEDKCFYEYSGVDWCGIVGVVWGNLWNECMCGVLIVMM